MRRFLAPAMATLLTISACGAPVLRPAATPAGVNAAGAVTGILPDFLNLARRSVEAVFQENDTDGNGKLSPKEADLPDDLFAKLDTNHDKSLSLKEMTPEDLIQSYAPVIENFFRSTFEAADRDHDGSLSQSEREQDAILAALSEDSRSMAAPGTWSYGTFTANVTRAMQELPATSRQHVAPRAGRTPVLVVQGYLEPSYYFMYGIYHHLQKQGWPVYGINLFPNVTYAEVQSRKVEAKIKQIMKETGASKINLVCHSFGGLISRRVIQKMGGDKYVDHYISVATPHYGTLWCYAGSVLGGACVDMHPDSPFLTDLNQQTIWSPVKYASIWTRTDEITIPAAKTNPLPGAKNYPPVPFTEHLLILFSPTTYGYIDDFLSK